MKVDSKLLEKYNIPVPRYTSYPPANHFKDGFTEKEYIKLIEESNGKQPEHIAFYIHIPFCKKICFYCGCNACTMRSAQLVEDYVAALKKEIVEVTKRLDKTRKVSQIHYGGGTPNAIDVKYLQEINKLLFEDFDFIEKPEIAIECNPAYLDYKYIDELLNAGFNRFSLGIQDFNDNVLKTVNRDSSALPVQDIVNYLKSRDSSVAVNLDFIYGLPGQSTESFLQTIQKAIEIKPDRLVTFSYAHVPWMKKHQQILEKKGLPSSDLKMNMFLEARELLKKAGYIPIGLDHYVLPNDELNLALNQHSLHRNFQGYCTRKTTGQVYAFGVSSISQLENAYVQNVKELESYIESLNKDKLPVEKGLILSQEQKLVREAITELMCNLNLNTNELSKNYHIDTEKFEKITNFTEDKLKEFIKDDLMNYKNGVIDVNETGSLFIRNIAATLDPEYLEQKDKYSKTV